MIVFVEYSLFVWSEPRTIGFNCDEEDDDVDVFFLCVTICRTRTNRICSCLLDRSECKCEYETETYS